MGQIIGTLFVGLIVGWIARFLLPGKQSMGLIMTSLLGVAGVVLLGQINGLAALLGGLGFVVYVGLYSLWLKRRSVYGTLVFQYISK